MEHTQYNKGDYHGNRGVWGLGTTVGKVLGLGHQRFTLTAPLPTLLPPSLGDPAGSQGTLLPLPRDNVQIRVPNVMRTVARGREGVRNSRASSKKGRPEVWHTSGFTTAAACPRWGHHFTAYSLRLAKAMVAVPVGRIALTQAPPPETGQSVICVCSGYLLSQIYSNRNEE